MGIFILFYRLIVIFRNTAFKLSRRIIFTFYIVYSLWILLIILALILGAANFGSYIGSVLAASALFIAMILNLFLIALYCNKLLIVFKQTTLNPNQKNKSMISSITKAFLLTIASILSLLFAITALVTLQPYNGKIFMVDMCVVIIFAIDIFTNFSSILFGFAPFSDYYIKVYGKCDTKMTSCCANRMKQKQKNSEHDIVVEISDTSALQKNKP